MARYKYRVPWLEADWERDFLECAVVFWVDDCVDEERGMPQTPWREEDAWLEAGATNCEMPRAHVMFC